MKLKVLNSLLLIVLIPVLNSCAVKEKLLIGGCNWDHIAIVDKKTQTIEWTHQLQKGDDCNDLEITKAGNILYAYKGGARLITKAQELLWDFKVEKGQELYTATELPSGEYLLGVCAKPSRIITLNSKGEKIKEQNFESGIANVHGQFRQILPTKDNSYIIPLMGKGEVIELTQTGEVIRRVTVGGNPFSAKIMADGNWMVACGDAHRLVIVDPRTQLVKDTISTSDPSKAVLLFVGEPQCYPDGNVMIANWRGHSKDKTQPQLVEMNSKSRVVWTLKSASEIANISAVFSFKTKE
jgi:outer membrane protein assembly factor BamB